MTSVDETFQIAQNKITEFLINNEAYISEYIMIPLFYESVFHTTSYITARSFILSLLILRQIIQKTNIKHIDFDMLFLLLPFTAYVTLYNNMGQTILYASVYSTNVYESVGLAVTTGYFSKKSFTTGYFLHIMYIIVRNHMRILLDPIDTHQSTIDFQIKTHEPLIFSERKKNLLNSCGIFINNQLEPLRRSMNF